MDHCLKIPEVIRLICDGIDSDSAYSMSLVARRFVEPALDIRWQMLPCLMPIIWCLPDDLWAIKRKDDVPSSGSAKFVVLRRAATPADLKRYLDVYARRIRTIDGYNTDVLVSSQVLQALQVATNFKPGVLSPSLERFYTTTVKPESSEGTMGNEYSASIGSTIWLFMHSKITAFSISASSSDPLYLTSIHLTATRLLGLRELTISIGYESLEDPFVDRYLRSSSWDQLEDLHIHVDCGDNFSYLEPATIQHLARLPRLKELALHDMTEVPSHHRLGLGGTTPSLEPSAYPFPSLTILSLNALVPSEIIAFLGYLPPKSKLTSLVCDTLNEDSNEDTQTIINMAHDLCDHHTLRMFTLKVNEFGGEDDETVELDEDGGLNIEPLLAFNKLQSLDIVVTGGYRITPDIAAQIPTAWPALEMMIFQSTFPMTQIPAIDHTHLLALVHGLPLLRHLGIRFNGTKISGHELAAGAPLALKGLYVGDSPKSSPSKTTSFIKANFSLRKPPGIHAWKTWKIRLCRIRWEVVRTSGAPWVGPD